LQRINQTLEGFKAQKKTRYSREGKIETPLTDQDFTEGIEHGKFLKPGHKEFCILLYYSAVRTSEALRTTKKNFVITRSAIMFDVGERLKHSKKTSALTIPLNAAYVPELKEWIEKTKNGDRVFPYCRKTGYNIVRRAFKYPHLFRLSRITNFFLEGWTIVQVRSWTGLSLRALEFYVGMVDIMRMGESLAKKK
jgi:integrase